MAQEIVELLCPEIGRELRKLSDNQWNEIQEIRLQADKPIYLTCKGKSFPLGQAIREKVHILRRQELEESFRSLCEYSVHTYLPQICQGYITLSNGHRVGIGGTAVLQEGKVTSVRDITSLNIRLLREKTGKISELYQKLFPGKLCSALIAGEPSSGKTTLLREMAVQLSNHYRVSVADERGEILPEQTLCRGGCLDRLVGFPKAAGILQAVRTLSPQIVVCDEIGSQEETNQLMEAIHCGVYFLGSIHAGNREELLLRPQFQTLMKEQVVERVVMLKGAEFPGEAGEIYCVEKGRLMEK